MTSSKAWPMPPLRRNDEEMAKKDDDHKHSTRRASGPWTAARVPRPPRALRLVAYLFAAAAVFFVLLHAMGIFGAAPDHTSPAHGHFFPDLSSPGPPDLPSPREPRPPLKPAEALSAPYPYKDPGKGRARLYNGPIKQHELGESLRSVEFISAGSARNRHVLFAAASLKSAVALLPLACQMASARLSQVHFMLVGRDDVPVAQLLKMNGIDPACPLAMHDARPDNADVSTDGRMTKAVERALSIFHRAAHPQAILIDSTPLEDAYFLRGVRDQARRMRTTVIELPENPHSRLAWITRLDASALAEWNRVRFDIVVHSPRSGTGNLKRLLRSLARADLGGHSLPHLVVELPSTTETPLEKLLAGYSWPPPYPGQRPMPSMLSLRRRVLRQSLTEEESSARFLEAFWPSDPLHSHVLVLSPHMEVGPHFFHYVKYSLLFQLHSRSAARGNRRSAMMGLSLSVPTTILGSTRPFTPPRPLRDGEAQAATGTAFLWQAPTSDAILIFGEKWVELHGYVSQVLARQYATSPPPAMLVAKEVGKQYPAWMEYMLQLARLRGYLTLYPSRQTADAIAGVHTDLPETPEEYQEHAGTRDEKAKAGDESSVLFDVASQVDMLETLPGEGEQQALDGLPLLAWDSQPVREDTLEENAAQFATEFRQQVGRCSDDDLAKLPRPDKHARDLFCQGAADRR